MPTIVRDMHIAEHIVFVDGLNGTGKSILAPVLGSFERVEKQRLEHNYEYICFLHYLGKMESDAGSALLNLYADLALYNSMISREVNLRPGDDSGILNNPHGLKYIQRLFRAGGEETMREIEQTRPILQIMTHQFFAASELVFEAFRERVRIIQMVRHPLYILEHWASYIDRYGTDKREFSIWFDSNGASLPWFAYGWEERFKSLRTVDKVIFSIDWLLTKMDAVYNRLDAVQKQQVLTIPFERFVTDPMPSLGAIEKLLGTQRTDITARVLKKQKCPRTSITAGKGHSHYGWAQPDKQATEADIYAKKRRYAEQHASPEALHVLERLCREYEQRYDVAHLFQ